LGKMICVLLILRHPFPVPLVSPGSSFSSITSGRFGICEVSVLMSLDILNCPFQLTPSNDPVFVAVPSLIGAFELVFFCESIAHIHKQTGLPKMRIEL
jgi:hypothetical protein